MMKDMTDLEFLGMLKEVAQYQAPALWWDIAEREVKAGIRLEQLDGVAGDFLLRVMAHALAPDDVKKAAPLSAMFTFVPGLRPLFKGSRSAAGRKAAEARWGNRGPDTPEAKAKRSDSARRAAATRRAKREAAASGGGGDPEVARMAKELKAKRDTGEPIDAIGDIAKRDDYVAFIGRNRDELGLSGEEAAILSDACLRIRAIEQNNATSNADMSGYAARKTQDNAVAFSDGDVMVATPSSVALTILGGERCKSQFETNTSRGMFDPNLRAVQETSMLRVHPGMAPEQRHTYGYVSVNMPTARGPSHYGQVRFQLKDDVAERTTFTIGDSLGSRATALPMRSTPSVQDAVRSEGWTSTGAQDTIDKIQTYSYGEAQIRGGWGVSDVARVYIPAGDMEVYAAAEAAGIPFEFYSG